MAQTQLVDLISLNTIYQNLLSNVNFKESTINSTISSNVNSLTSKITANTTSINNLSTATPKLAGNNTYTGTNKFTKKSTFNEESEFNKNVTFGESTTLNIKNVSDFSITEVASGNNEGDMTVSGTPSVSLAGGLKVAGVIQASSLCAGNIYNKTQVDREIAKAVNTTFKYKGQKETEDDLPATGNNTGDVWDVRGNGHNYVWNGTAWDDLGDNGYDLDNFEGTEKIIKVGTITTGTWNGEAIAKGYHYTPKVSTEDTDKDISVPDSSSSSVTTTSLSAQDTFVVPELTYDSRGHIISGSTIKYKLPADTTYSVANYNTLGLIKPIKSYSAGAISLTTAHSDNTTTTITVNDTSTTAGRYYCIEVDKNGVPFVNVPWVNTDTKVTSASNHYTPSADSSSVLSATASGTSYASFETDSVTATSVITGFSINRDSKGHVTGISATSVKLPKQNSISTLGNITTATSFTNTTASTSTTTGAVKISGGLGVKGNIYGAKVYNAVWNDIADCITVDCELEPGYCYSFDGEHYYKTNSYLDGGCIGIHSDTAGFHVGSKGGNEMHVAIGGFVLAYIDKEYAVGTPLTCTENGILTEIKLEDKINYPERILATYWKNEPNDEWGSENDKVKVNGRKWVKIK